ncbi:hypothetical protein BY996DRAFT_7071798 [Phakopsora pachyrhizi]|nr:hypothetical protein BY996DRAFT_7071798 [Phakopsora pachyrhizi]
MFWQRTIHYFYSGIHFFNNINIHIQSAWIQRYSIFIDIMSMIQTNKHFLSFYIFFMRSINSLFRMTLSILHIHINLQKFV